MIETNEFDEADYTDIVWAQTFRMLTDRQIIKIADIENNM
jgi:hypothetical protein